MKDENEDKDKDFTCPKCNHSWVSRVRNPKRCPNCTKVLAKIKKIVQEKKEEPIINVIGDLESPINIIDEVDF